jgi:hypothetical protein
MTYAVILTVPVPTRSNTSASGLENNLPCCCVEDWKIENEISDFVALIDKPNKNGPAVPARECFVHKTPLD